MKCNFDPNLCSVDCKKYPICSYFSIQNQISNIQSQLNFIYDTMNKLLRRSETNDTKIDVLQEAFYDFACRITDSEKIINEKESKDNEKNNK